MICACGAYRIGLRARAPAGCCAEYSPAENRRYLAVFRRHGPCIGDLSSAVFIAGHGRRRRKIDGGLRSHDRPKARLRIFILTALIGGVAALILVIARGRARKTFENIGHVISSLRLGESPVREPSGTGCAEWERPPIAPCGDHRVRTVAPLMSERAAGAPSSNESVEQQFEGSVGLKRDAACGIRSARRAPDRLSVRRGVWFTIAQLTGPILGEESRLDVL